MENHQCPHCESPVGNGVTVCGECGKELDAGQEVKEQTPAPETRSSGKKIYAILALFLVVVGGAALLLSTGTVPNPLKGGTSVAAIVNGEKIYQQDVDQKLEVYKKIYGQSTQIDFTSPEGQKALMGIKKQMLKAMIQKKILVTEAAKENIVVSPQEIKDRISAIKKEMKLADDKDLEAFLKEHMGIANLEKWVEQETRISKLVARGAEKGLTVDAWFKTLNDRAKVEVLMK
jgi:hypothetical protein